MKISAYFASVVMALIPVATQAAVDKNVDGTLGIERQLKSALPATLRDLLQISPEGGNRYRAHVSLAPGLTQFKSVFQITEMTPLDFLFDKAVGQTWNIAAHGQAMSVVGDTLWTGQTTHFQYLSGSYDLTAAFDEAVRSTTAKLLIKDLDIHSDSLNNEQLSSSSIKDYKVVAKVAHGEKGLLQGSAEITSQTAREMRKFRGLPDEYILQAKSVHDLTSFAGFDAGGVTSIATALMQKDDPINTTIVKLIVAFRDHPSLLENLDDHATWDDDELSFRDIKLFANHIEHHLKFFGTPQDYAVGVDLSLDHPTAKPGRFPHAIEQAMPDKAAFGFTLRRLDPEAALLTMVRTQRLQNKAKRRRDIALAAFSHGLKVDFQDTYARSQFYDITLSGSLDLNLADRRDQGEANFTITARDLDKTVSFLQTNANSVPQFGQASFFVLMAKGLGKQQPDGTIVWNVNIDRSAAVTVNGRPLPRF